MQEYSEKEYSLIEARVAFSQGAVDFSQDG